MTSPFFLIDVFSSAPFNGNPLAVIVANDLPTDEMQTITRWLNLSETTFLMPPIDPAADYRVRIFAQDREMPFAGHPTLGTCQAWLSQGGQPKNGNAIIQECGAGLVRIRRDGERLAFAAPPLIRSGPVSVAEREEFAAILRIDASNIVDAQWADNGPGWVAVRLATAAEVLALTPLGSYPRTVDIGVVGPHPVGSETAFEIRTFFSDQFGNLHEDPITGSFNASAAQWLLHEGLAKTPYVVAQGTKLDRAGRAYINQDETGQVWVGGDARVLFEGRTTW